MIVATDNALFFTGEVPTSIFLSKEDEARFCAENPETGEGIEVFYSKQELLALADWIHENYL